MTTPNYECCTEVRCTVARDIANALKERATECETAASDSCCCSDHTRELKLEAKVLRSAARVIAKANVKRT